METRPLHKWRAHQAPANQAGVVVVVAVVVEADGIRTVDRTSCRHINVLFA